jgi:hypothetical protein
MILLKLLLKRGFGAGSGEIVGKFPIVTEGVILHANRRNENQHESVT